jgi:hypothetical protein
MVCRNSITAPLRLQATHNHTKPHKTTQNHTKPADIQGAANEQNSPLKRLADLAG